MHVTSVCVCVLYNKYCRIEKYRLDFNAIICLDTAGRVRIVLSVYIFHSYRSAYDLFVVVVSMVLGEQQWEFFDLKKNNNNKNRIHRPFSTSKPYRYHVYNIFYFTLI